MISSRLSKENLKDISVGTVHTFQGKKQKLFIWSLVQMKIAGVQRFGQLVHQI